MGCTVGAAPVEILPAQEERVGLCATNYGRVDVRLHDGSGDGACVPAGGCLVEPYWSGRVVAQTVRGRARIVVTPIFGEPAPLR